MHIKLLGGMDGYINIIGWCDFPIKYFFCIFANEKVCLIIKCHTLKLHQNRLDEKIFLMN